MVLLGHGCFKLAWTVGGFESHLCRTKKPMAALTHHIFVCCNRREPGHRRGCCDPDGAELLRSKFKAGIKARGLAGVVRANKAGCLDQCELGPTVVIYPQAIWYGGVTVADVDRILDATVLGNRVLEDLEIPEPMLNTKGKGTGSAAPNESESGRAS